MNEPENHVKYPGSANASPENISIQSGNAFTRKLIADLTIMGENKKIGSREQGLAGFNPRCGLEPRRGGCIACVGFKIRPFYHRKSVVLPGGISKNDLP